MIPPCPTHGNKTTFKCIHCQNYTLTNDIEREIRAIYDEKVHITLTDIISVLDKYREGYELFKES